MASSLTSTSLKSGFLYFTFLMIILAGVVYLFSDRSDSYQNLRKQAFLLTSSAFKNGIYFAHSKFQVRQNQEQYFDLWVDETTGLDFNKKGYPIGTSISNINQQKPKTAKHCKEIWQFVLGSLQPELVLAENENDYWVQLTSSDICIYHSPFTNKMQLSYHSLTGKIELVE